MIRVRREEEGRAVLCRGVQYGAWALSLAGEEEDESYSDKCQRRGGGW